MGSDVTDVVDALISPGSTKVHAQMCSELRKLIIRVSQILSDIEAVRPGGSSGIESLCLLNNGIAKARSLLQYCSESSVLYLALTGDAILSRCKRSRNMLEQSLSQIQNMVPVILAAKISGVLADLRSATFSLDAREEEAGRVLQDLLHRYGSTLDSMEDYALSAIHAVSSQLQLSSKKALLVEKRSIKKLLDKVDSSETSKRNILLFFLNLLKVYGTTLPNDNGSSLEDSHLLSLKSRGHYLRDVELCTGYRCDVSKPVPPEEFICPLSSRLMYDPVIIASGQTYERMWIQKWLDEGNDICPKTNMKLDHLSFTSNIGLRDLILKWSVTHDISIPDPNVEGASAAIWETPTNSVSSLSSSINDLSLRLDFGNIEASQGAGLSTAMKYTQFSSNFSTLSWDSQCKAVKDLLKLLTDDNKESWSEISQMNLMQPLVSFLKDAFTFLDMEALMNGCLLLLELIQKYRMEIPSSMTEDLCNLLASFLDTDVSAQAITILETLSSHPQYCHEISRSNAVGSILNILDAQIHDFLQPALSILSNLSSTFDITSMIDPNDLILKLIPLLEETALSMPCLLILKNLCEKAEGRRSIAETDGCISSVAYFLEEENKKLEEHAISIILSLCCHKVNYCELVMEEGVIPGLVHVSVNGNRKAKTMALELLRILKSEFSKPSDESSGKDENISRIKEHTIKAPSNSKTQVLFSKIFCKPSGMAAMKKN